MVNVIGILIFYILLVVVICVIGVINKIIKIDKYLNVIEIYIMNRTQPRKPRRNPTKDKYVIMRDIHGREREYYWANQEAEQRRVALELQEQVDNLENKKEEENEKVGLKTKACCIVQNEDKIKIEW